VETIMQLVHRIPFVALVAWSAAAAAQGDYPSRPIRMVIPLAAASVVDNAARVLAARMSENMGQPFVIENIAGASGLIGAERVAKSAPDGYTIGAFDDTILTMLPNLHAKMPFDVLRDFEPVSLVGTIEWGLVAADNAPFRSAGDLISAASAKPGGIGYASGGNGSPEHVAMAQFASMANISLVHVPYEGATRAAAGIAAGQVPVGMQGLDTVAPLVRAGKIRLIGVATPQRYPQFPDVPTIGESGLPGVTFTTWLAVVAPAGTAKEIVVRLNAEIARALAAPDVREKLTSQGFTLRGTSQDELASITRAQLARYAKVMKEAGIRVE
jgi:tripartite-type tricarboxylate transporter receptor subunit TctC